MTSIGLLHPGAMGASLGAELVNAGHGVFWVPDGRSAESHERAEAADLVGVPSLPALVEQVDAIVSICPPHAAVDVAGLVAASGFDGLYVDANAVAPTTTAAIGDKVAPARFVDGAVVGPPASAPGDTRLYLSGAEAAAIAEWFVGTRVEPVVLDGRIGAASALKAAFATWTKVSSAMLAATADYAQHEGVLEALRAEWQRRMPDTVGRLDHMAPVLAEKAWRFEGEMHEAAIAFEDAAMPAGFHRAAAEVYRRIAASEATPD